MKNTPQNQRLKGWHIAILLLLSPLILVLFIVAIICFVIESIMLRGLLLGTKASSRGIWGVYGSYDYIAPYLFRVSNTALSVGMTRADGITGAVALQTSILF